MDSNYETAIEVSGILKYRSYFPTIWAKKIMNVGSSLFGTTPNYYRLIAIELHSIVGDMLHIARMNNDRDYEHNVERAMRAQYQYQWVDGNPVYRSYSYDRLEKLKVPEMPEECYNSGEETKEAFVRMMNFFQQWEQMQGNEEQIGNLYFQIADSYCMNNSNKYSYEPYKQILLSKYRMQRKLDLKLQHFLIYNTKTYKEAWSKHMNRLSLQPIVINPPRIPVYNKEEERKKEEQLIHAAGYYYQMNQQKRY